MQTTIEKISPTNVVLSIDADGQELLTAKRQAIKNLNVNVKVPGFRTGKAPESLAEKHLDPNAISQEALELAVNMLYANALVKEQLRPVKNPEVTVKSYIPYDQLSFTAAVEVIGDIKLGDYKGLDIKAEPVKVSTDEIEEVITNLRHRSAIKKSIKRPVKKGDEAIIDFNGVDAQTGETIPGASAKDYPLLIGSSSFIPGFEDQIVGMNASESKLFDVVFPDDYAVESLRNKKVSFNVTLKQLNELKLPKLDDSFAKKAGPFSSLTELKQDIKKQLLANKQAEALAKQQNDIVNKVVSTSAAQLPDSLVDEECSRLKSEQRQTAAYKGMTWNEYLASMNLTADQFDKTARDQAEQRIKMGLVLGLIANNENLTISKQELKQKLDQLKDQFKDDSKMQEELKKPENQQDIHNRLLVDKTINRLTELNS